MGACARADVDADGDFSTGALEVSTRFFGLQGLPAPTSCCGDVGNLSGGTVGRGEVILGVAGLVSMSAFAVSDWRGDDGRTDRLAGGLRGEFA